jgi:hypothetical protein
MNGTFDLIFQLWDAASGGALLGAGDIVRNDVPVTEGLFTVQLDVPHDAFNGQGLWLQVNVEGQTLSPRQALLPMPYALSLRPGANIVSPGPDTLHVGNEAGGWAVEAWSRNNIAVLGTSGAAGGSPPSGLHGVHGIGAGVGVYGEGVQTGVKGESASGNGVTGQTAAADKSGVYGHSDVGIGVTGRSEGNDGVLAVTTSSEPGIGALRARNEGGGPAVFAEGDLYVTGALRGNVGPGNGAPFPRPAWDSGWVQRTTGVSYNYEYNLGGDVEDYFVDMWCRRDDPNPPYNDWGIHRPDIQYDLYEEWSGAGWYNLTNKTIRIMWQRGDRYCDSARVRIWVIK